MSVLAEKITHLRWIDDTDNCVDTEGVKYTLHYDGKETLVDEKGNHYEFKTNSSGMTRLTLDPFYTDKEEQEKWADQMAISCFKHEHNLTDDNIAYFAKRFIGREYKPVYNMLVGIAPTTPGAIGKFVPMGGETVKENNEYYETERLEHESAKYSLVFKMKAKTSVSNWMIDSIDYVAHEQRKRFV